MLTNIRLQISVLLNIGTAMIKYQCSRRFFPKTLRPRATFSQHFLHPRKSIDEQKWLTHESSLRHTLAVNKQGLNIHRPKKAGSSVLHMRCSQWYQSIPWTKGMRNRIKNWLVVKWYSLMVLTLPRRGKEYLIWFKWFQASCFYKSASKVISSSSS